MHDETVTLQSTVLVQQTDLYIKRNNGYSELCLLKYLKEYDNITFDYIFILFNLFVDKRVKPIQKKRVNIYCEMPLNSICHCLKCHQMTSNWT